MECPKCHRKIGENETVCPHCHKVIALECPNCHRINHSSVCESCGYIILTKCSKCGKTVHTAQEKCKCGFPTKTSVAYQECETDEFASILIQFSALKNIRRLLGSQELFSKFYFRLKNLLTSQLKGIEGKVIIYNDVFVVNFNKELSFPTSSNKAVRLAIKLANAFSELNSKIIEELGCPLNLNMTITKKTAEELLAKTNFESNVKLLEVKKDDKKFLKGMQIILDQFVWDCVNKDYKTDSLYSVEIDNSAVMFYEILLESYVLPPSEKSSEETIEVQQKTIKKQEKKPVDDIYSFKVFDINAKCKFHKVTADSLLNSLDDNKIISIRSAPDLEIQTSELVDYYESKGFKVIRTVCTEELTYKPWGILEQLARDFWKLSAHNSLINTSDDYRKFKAIFDLILFNGKSKNFGFANCLIIFVELILLLYTKKS